MGILGTEGAAVQLGLSGELSLSKTLLPTASVGLLRTTAGKVLVRDVQTGLRWMPVREKTLVWSVTPGVSLPLGSVSANAGPLPTTSGSVDPTVRSDLVVGGQALALVGVQARVPLIEGRDGIVQGPYLRADVRGALRQGAVVPWLGVSGLRQAPHDFRDETRAANAAPLQELWELAVVAGAAIELGATTGLGVQVRVPMWTDATERYLIAPGLSLRQVLGSPAAKK